MMGMKVEKSDTMRCRRAPTRPCDDKCIYKRSLSILGKKHTLDIIRILIYDQPTRFTAIQKQIHGSPKTLTDRLNELRSLGIIKREAFAEIPPRVEYSLTEKGMTLTPVMNALRIWAEQWDNEG